MTKKINKVAIIGAGISGLSCATVLKNFDWQVTLYEKSRGVSGRLSTRIHKHWHCDHGAQYFTAKDSLFAEELKRWTKADVARLWEPTLKVFDGKSFSSKSNEKDIGSMRYVGYPRNHSPAKWLSQSLDVMTETTIVSVTKKDSKWQLTSKERGLHPEYFDFIILSMPAPQVATLLKDSGSKLAALCSEVVMRPCFALMVHLTQRLNCQFDGLFINSGLLSWVARDSSKPGRKDCSTTDAETWVLHATSKWSQNNIDAPKHLVEMEMLKEFRRILQSENSTTSSGQLDIQSDECDLHRWMYADCEQYLTDIYHFDAIHNIGLCGDWLNGGKIQGAWLSGYKLAERVINS
jgi:hypothetical protein